MRPFIIAAAIRSATMSAWVQNQGGNNQNHYGVARSGCWRRTSRAGNRHQFTAVSWLRKRRRRTG